ncbi:MAG: radical SAM protein [Firmicutes bacterium]|nr:radical SAM protein [Bacillota bacterium]
MIRLSLGTAALLGLIRMQTKSLPTTAYLLHGEGCLMNCSFCPQAREAQGRGGRLGRVTWPPFSKKEVVAALQRAAGEGLQRICLQAVCEPGIRDTLAGLVRLLSESVTLPLSLSAPVRSTAEAALLFKAGAERISIAIDAASDELYSRHKGGNLQKRLALLRECARLWPGRMNTHLICGLGETEEELALLLHLLQREGITVGLFAFTPLKGTALEGQPPPEPASYRRLQSLHYLLRQGHVSWKNLHFSEGRLISFGIGENEMRHLLGGGEAFQTSGCPGCNRPYFNERPGGFIYNYPHPLSTAEIAAALSLTNHRDSDFGR